MKQNIFLITCIAGKRVAIDASVVESVVKVGEVIAVPKTAKIVAGQYALRSRVLTLIDCQFRVTGTPSANGGQNLAVIISIGLFPYGFLVEKVEDVVTIPNSDVQILPASSGAWSEISSGFIEIDGNAVVIVDPEKIVSCENVQQAA